MTGTIVIGFDATDSGEDALALGILIARATGDRAIVTTVYPGEYESGMGRVDAEYVAYMREGPTRRWGARAASSAPMSARRSSTGRSRRARRPMGSTSSRDSRAPRSSSSAARTGRRCAGSWWAAPASGSCTARARPSAWRTALASLPDDLDARSELLEGDPVETLAALDERDCDLLVCGSRGYDPVRRVLLGGVASRLMRRAATPVVIVPRGAGELLGGHAREEQGVRQGV
jgi:hypothetical protein